MLVGSREPDLLQAHRGPQGSDRLLEVLPPSGMSKPANCSLAELWTLSPDPEDQLHSPPTLRLLGPDPQICGPEAPSEPRGVPSHSDVLAGDVAGVWGAQEGHKPRTVLRLPDPTGKEGGQGTASVLSHSGSAALRLTGPTWQWASWSDRVDSAGLLAQAGCQQKGWSADREGLLLR